MLITYTSIAHMTQAGFSAQTLSTWFINNILYKGKIKTAI